MVIDASNLHRNDVIVSRDAAQVFPDALFDGLSNPSLAVLGGKDNVTMERRVGVRRDCLRLVGSFLGFIEKSLRR